MNNGTDRITDSAAIHDLNNGLFSELRCTVFLRVNCLLGPFIFTVVSLKKGPTIPIVLHTAWAHALSAIVIVCPHGKMHAIQIRE